MKLMKNIYQEELGKQRYDLLKLINGKLKRNKNYGNKAISKPD